MTGPDAPEVLRDPTHDRFVIEVQGTEAELVYRRSRRRLVLIHTGVPQPLAGRGLGGRLVRAAVDWATAESLTVVPWCPYARAWLEDHPDAAATVTIDWELRPPLAGRGRA